MQARLRLSAFDGGLPHLIRLDKAGARSQGSDVRVAVACLIGLLVYPVASWLVRLAVTVLTLPFAGMVREAESRLASRLLRLVGGAICGAAGLVVSHLTAARLGAPGAWPLAALLAAFVAFAHVPWLRRLAGGPQAGDEALSFVGEEFGLLASVLALIL